MIRHHCIIFSWELESQRSCGSAPFEMTSAFAYVIKVTTLRLGSVLRPYVKHGATADPRWAHKCALHFAAAWGHRGTLVGELAARTSLRGDVEVARPATYRGLGVTAAAAAAAATTAESMDLLVPRADGHRWRAAPRFAEAARYDSARGAAPRGGRVPCVHGCLGACTSARGAAFRGGWTTSTSPRRLLRLRACLTFCSRAWLLT